MPCNHLGFNVLIGQHKPENIINTKAECPFCDRAALTDIIDQTQELLLIKNKYHVLQDSCQTVLIETTECDSDLSEYSKEHLHRLMRFGVKHWRAMIESGEYKSVLFFKNHGPLSGGTIRHPHMQIVGLKSADYTLMYDDTDFWGLPIDRSHGVELNISTRPRVGFSEFNIITADNSQLERMADYMQIAVRYLLSHFNHRCKSYNIFFYYINELIRIKIMPRFATSPLYIGYGIHLIPNNLEQIADEFRQLYFQDKI